MTGSLPGRVRTSRIPEAVKPDVNRQLGIMKKRGFIVPSKSPVAMPLVIVFKKDGGNQICIDIRLINKITKKGLYPMRRIDECLDALGGACWFTSLDLQSGYWPVPMDPASHELTAFQALDGHYEFAVMSFGLVNAGATCQRLLELVLAGLQNH